MRTSTHDLHTEVDIRSQFRSLPTFYFNSRPPHGGRRGIYLAEDIRIRTSTHDLHTEVDCTVPYRIEICSTSTHDLHTEVDFFRIREQLRMMALQLTTSTRRSTNVIIEDTFLCETSTHDLHTEVDSNFSQNRQEHSITFTALFLSNPLSHPFPPPFLCLAATFSSLFLVRIPRDFLFTSHSH